ncbi:Modification methylase DpnIIA [BD1-7 clade bacterium]|uniref:site-specific DNA-methyltransferase (adenine-specific) n=1 Tax=BD1-7 clade bacterium TaxID=2029982 RepID=A0A5S9NN96_9GAMM|nr:Modification methylase DpnIIA [BD1-7 clade bacterium]CAA0094406.1 Modification methylase DpnIIA [BD1-7 clade bacterium]
MAKPVIPWVGGKRKLADHILPLFPEHTCYVEPFCGAAALYFIKEPSKVEVINDVNGDIVNLYRVVKHHLEELYKQFKWALTSRENWHWLQATPPETLTDVQRAARFLYLQKLAFGGKVEGQSFGTATSSRPRFNIFTLEQDLADAHYRLSNTTIEHLDWANIIERYDRPHTLFYCDPPYWETEGYGIDFPWEQYERMAELSKTIQGKMIISINSHPAIRDLFSHLPVVAVDYQYTVAGADKRTDCTELIYGNWDNNEVPFPKGQPCLF